jgi:putative tricarboxylic transport membrane protein
MFKPVRKILAVSLVLALSVAVTGCSSQTSNASATKEQVKKVEYPTKAVTVIHGFKAGGGSDQLSQLVQPYLEKVLGQKFANVYKPGADGAIAWKEIAKSTTPDGYTLSTVLTPKTQLNSFINKDAGYAMEDFEPVANVVFDPGMLVVGPDSKFKTMKDLIDYAKANPGKLKMSNSGEGGDDWFNAVMIEKLAGVKFNNIPFEGDAPAWQAAAGGHVDANTNNLSTVTPLIKGGKLKPLAVYTEKRVEEFPDVPTLKELGIDLVVGSSRGYIAPKGTPKEVIDILADGIEKVTKDPEFIKAAKAANIEIQFLKGEENKKFLAAEKDRLKKIVDEMKLSK